MYGREAYDKIGATTYQSLRINVDPRHSVGTWRNDVNEEPSHMDDSNSITNSIRCGQFDLHIAVLGEVQKLLDDVTIAAYYGVRFNKRLTNTAPWLIDMPDAMVDDDMVNDWFNHVVDATGEILNVAEK